MNFIIKNESINTGLLELCYKVGYNIEDFNKVITNNTSLTNASNRLSDYKKYYDDESINLIKTKEHLIINKHDYNF